MKVWHGNREVQRSVKLSLVQMIFYLCFYFNSHQKGARLYKRGATAVWGSNCPKLSPPDSPMVTAT